MNVLVTGATGRVGVRLVERLLAEKLHSVRVLTRRPFAAEALFGTSVPVFEWHPYSEHVPPAALIGVDRIVHLMGAPFLGAASPENFDAIAHSRIGPLQRLLQAIGNRRTRLVVTSVAVPPPSEAAVVTDLDAAREPITPLEKAMAAYETVAFSAASGSLGVAVVRLGLVLAPGEPFTRLVRLAVKGMAPSLAGSQIPVIGVDDATAMLSGLLALPDLDGLFYGVGPEPLKGGDLDALLAHARRLPIGMPLPRRLAARRLGPLAPVLQCRSRIVPKRLLDAGAAFATPDPLPVATRLIEALIDRERNARPSLLRPKTA